MWSVGGMDKPAAETERSPEMAAPKSWSFPFFLASLFIFYFISSHVLRPAKKKIEFSYPMVFGGNEPHYLIVISSIFDHDLSLGDTASIDAARDHMVSAPVASVGHSLEWPARKLAVALCCLKVEFISLFCGPGQESAFTLGEHSKKRRSPGVSCKRKHTGCSNYRG